MGQQDVLDLLKKNKEIFFSAKEISNALKISPQSVISALNKLNNYGEIQCRDLKVSGGVLDSKRTYSYKESNTNFEKALTEYTNIVNQQRFQLTGREVIRDMLMLAELKAISELLKEAKE